jgi:hypothetical protein
MRWLIVLAAIGAAVVAAQILIWERRSGRHRPSTLGQFAGAVLTVAVMGGAIYSAHLLGIFSIPLVAVVFVPFGVAMRWLILHTRASRQRAEDARAAAPAATRRARLLEQAAFPVFIVLVGAVLVVALVVGTLVGPH